MEIRWGLSELPGLLAELSIERPLLVASDRWSSDQLPVDVAGVWSDVPSDRIDDAVEAAGAGDGLLAVGGGSAIDLAKAISAGSGLPMVSVPTTYSGSEWTEFFGVRDGNRRMQGGGSGATLAGVVYEPELTMSLPRAETVGTALNALAHSAEALYVKGRSGRGDRHAFTGARPISYALPLVVDDPESRYARTRLLEGAMRSGMALAEAGMGLGHAMAQALGGRYGLPHGALNAVTLPPALRFNAPVAGAEIARFGEAMGTDDPVGRVEGLARLGGFARLRDLGVPEDELGEVAEAAAARPAARANPRPASAPEIEELFRSVW
jgi:maleylacetate reductase